jgi:hypothetical protein
MKLRWVGGIMLFMAAMLGANEVFVRAVREAVRERQLSFTDERPIEVLQTLLRDVAIEDDQPDLAERLPRPQPFVEAEAFDDEAHSYSQMFSDFGGGIAVFDANGDGRLDVYLVHDGRNWTRPTDENGVLSDEPRCQRNILYLNQGNDTHGRPIFARIDELAKRNDTFVREELLVEGYLYPRENVSDSSCRPGRKANGVLVADFNNDGRPDLYVGNQPDGMPWSHANTWRVLHRFVNPEGRSARHSTIPLMGMGLAFIDYTPTQGTLERIESARGTEPEGANSLYINLGDRDGDGISEWEDVSRQAGVEGKGASYGLIATDIDLDGDLDIFVSNIMDGDFWPGGSKYWAGGLNELFVNQLAETGKLQFVERAAELNVNEKHGEPSPMPPKYRLRRLPLLPPEYSVFFPKFEEYRPDYLVINGGQGEPAEISWHAQFQDVNDDGYPDLWVANDLSYLRLYLNQNGRRFVPAEHVRSDRSGAWMSLTAADFDGDLHEDLFAGNMGGAMLTHGFIAPDIFAAFEPVMVDSLAWAQFVLGKHDTTHAIIDGSDYRRELSHRVRHSRILPPDASLPNNIRSRSIPNVFGLQATELHDFDPDSIDPYEFAWGSVAFDVQNNGRPDLYWLGCLYNRGGGIFAIMGTNPGRLLLNASEAGAPLRFVDLTAEHHLFNIEELRYDRLETDGYIHRPAPAQNWRARDVVHSYDRSVWVSQGRNVSERVINHDLIQTAEYGRAVVVADLNGNGFDDLLLTNQGGYDSKSSKATNLKAMIDGRPQVLPPPDFNYPTLTNYEPGRTRLFLNTYSENRWIKVRLVDDEPRSLNRDGIGARVTINGRKMQVKRAGMQGYLGAVYDDLRFGLGKGGAERIEVVWPDKQRTRTTLTLGSLRDGTLVVSKTRGVVDWRPAAPVPRVRPSATLPAPVTEVRVAPGEAPPTSGARAEPAGGGAERLAAVEAGR